MKYEEYIFFINNIDDNYCQNNCNIHET